MPVRASAQGAHLDPLLGGSEMVEMVEMVEMGGMTVEGEEGPRQHGGPDSYSLAPFTFSPRPRYD